MAQQQVFEWGNARRQLEQQLVEARAQREHWEGREAQIVESLSALDITVDTLNKLPEGVSQLVLMALKAQSVVEATNPRTVRVFEAIAGQPQVEGVPHRPLRPAKALGKPGDPVKPRVYNLLHTDRGTYAQDIAYILKIHISTVSKTLAEGQRRGEVHFVRSTDSKKGAQNRKSWFLNEGVL